MKSIAYILRALSAVSLLLSLLVLPTSCEQQNYEPNYNAAPGGGTVSTYKAYTLSSATGTTIYGRVVFYKYSAKITLVEIGLYNTASTATYSSSIYQGKVALGSATALKPLDTISGTTGEFATNKYFTMSDEDFYKNLDKYDANVKVMSGTTLIASGDIGANATPVAQQ